MEDEDEELDEVVDMIRGMLDDSSLRDSPGKLDDLCVYTHWGDWDKSSPFVESSIRPASVVSPPTYNLKENQEHENLSVPLYTDSRGQST